MGRRFTVRGIDAFGKVRPLGLERQRNWGPALTIPVSLADDGGRQNQDRIRRSPYAPLPPLARPQSLTTVGRARSRTTVTLVSLSLIVMLTVWEYIDYRRVHMVSFSFPRLSHVSARSHRLSTGGEICRGRWRRTLLTHDDVLQEPSVLVDRTRGEKLVVNLDITFPRVPCYRESDSFPSSRVNT